MGQEETSIMTEGEDMHNENFTLEQWSNPMIQTWKVSANNKVTEIESIWFVLDQQLTRNSSNLTFSNWA